MFQFIFKRHVLKKPAVNITRKYSSTLTTPEETTQDKIRKFVQTLDENPVSDIVDKKTYEVLNKERVFSEKAIRDYIATKIFRYCRSELNMSAGDAIDTVREYYPYLRFDTVRKIVYNTNV